MKRAFPLLQFGVDALAWAPAIALTAVLRYDLRVGPVNEFGVIRTAAVAAVLQAVVGLGLGLYRRRYHYGSLEEVRVVATSVAVVAMALSAAVWLMGGGRVVPMSVPVLSGFVALVIMAVARFAARLIEDQHLRPPVDGSQPIVIVGAGRPTRQLVRTLLTTPDSPYRPVALLDDDPARARTQVAGLRVEGRGADVVAVARRYGATSVLVAAPDLAGEALTVAASAWMEAGMRVLVVPPLATVVGELHAADIRPLTIADLLGRREAEVDVAAIAGFVTGRRVLVTGAGGSIGSELCRQLGRYSPASLVMLDRDESGLHGTQLSIEGRALLDSPALVLADIRDRDRMFEVFHQHRPEVVFHAAALKHLPLLELNPLEGWKTNVVGTANVLDAAVANGVDQLVNISTDKAADPTSVLGFTKRLSERMTAAVAVESGNRYVSVRFGNVLGSKGSMLGTFERQIANGGPVTVTHPDVTRYFMTTEEAVALTIQAAAIGEGGEALVLDMGEPVRIDDIARRLIHQAGDGIEVVYTGLRPGEKLHEVLVGAGEVGTRPHHSLISHVDVPPLSYETLRDACSVEGRLSLSVATLELACGVGLAPGEPGAATMMSVDVRHDERPPTRSS
ncbi:MAG: polysaccharide biosynthesis protein [Desertimonas sp.]